MAFNRFTKSVLNVSALPDRVENQASTLKATFDQAGVDIKDGLNALIEELEVSTAAANIGAKNTQSGNSTVQTELNTLNTKMADKVDKVTGKQLSTEDFTTEAKTKLENIAEGANNYVLPQASTSELGGIRIDGSTIVIEDGVAKAKGADAADYTARAAIEELSDNVLKKDNTTEYTPTQKYHPATKEYVDSKGVDSLTADKILSGTFGGQVNANATAVSNLATSQVRNISISETDLESGVSSLTTGEIVFVYE